MGRDVMRAKYAFIYEAHKGTAVDTISLNVMLYSLLYCYRRFGILFIIRITGNMEPSFKTSITVYQTSRRHVLEYSNFLPIYIDQTNCMCYGISSRNHHSAVPATPQFQHTMFLMSLCCLFVLNRLPSHARTRMLAP